MLTQFKIIIFFVFFASLLSGCNPKPNPVPPLAQDSTPVVKIIHLVIAGEGKVDPPFETGFTGQNVIPDPYVNSQKAICDRNTKLLLTVQSNNFGGVKDLSVIVKHLNGVVIYATSLTGALDANGKGPDTLTILTKDGNVNSDPMIVTVADYEHPIFVEVVSHNFNNQETRYVGQYLVRK